MTGVNEVRSTFLNYFKGHGHEAVASSPLVPHNDPTLMFVNAGMVQFKNVFTGQESRDYSRATTAQKCVRAGGKHNDLDNVGYTARHHTFFEMLGNFSFGDYFKEEAIELAWNLTTREFGLDPDKLLITVHSSDEDAAALWRKIAGLPDEKIIRIPTSDNFWSMGETGPCGPCSEIFIDQGPELAGGPPGSPDEDGDRFLEFWNLVFMQYEQVTSAERIDLPKPSIDTGMGLERIAAILQGVKSNYDTDLFQTIIHATADLVGREPDAEERPSFNVIADHLRATSFLIADGVLPSNEGRGYVLRRIMRRAMRHAHILGTQDPLMYRLVPVLVSEMGQAFPELVRGQALITETLKLEETRFRETLERGLGLLEVETARLGEGETLPGEIAFRLYDTFGFPYDLTEDALRREGRGVDREGFDAAMAEQKAKARAAWSGSGGAATEQLWFDLHEQVGASEFLGYGATQAQGQIVALVRDGAEVDKANAGDEVMVVLNQTPFYGESGGQMGDTGLIETSGAEIAVSDTQKKLGALHVHIGTVTSGSVAVGDEATLTVDAVRRDRLRANHSATHLLHEALRRRLGDHVTQKGSLVAEDRLRFDISHPKGIEDDELAAVEAEVNAAVRANSAVATTLMTPDEAIEAGALALFGEKYGDEVRVVSMGEGSGSGKENDKPHYSTELCGGTHVERTGDIGAFKILSEGAVASGVRRIEALTGQAALEYLTDQDRRVRALAGHLKTKPTDLETRVESLVEERRRLEREVEQLREKLASRSSKTQVDEEKIGNFTLRLRHFDGTPVSTLRKVADDDRNEVKDIVSANTSVSDGKFVFVVGSSSSVSANDVVKIVTERFGGSGGGRSDLATGGGTVADDFEDFDEYIKNLIREKAKYEDR